MHNTTTTQQQTHVLLLLTLNTLQTYYESLKSTKLAAKFWNATSADDYVTNSTVFAPIDKARVVLCFVLAVFL